MRFWDSAAVVLLVVAEQATEQAERWLEQDAKVVVWTLTVVEVASALERLVREGALTLAELQASNVLLRDLVTRAYVAEDVESATIHAQRLLRTHALRAADALQLGAALVWTEGRPEGFHFHTFDQRLPTAALKEGFTLG
jgi:predicted nucleic acid-binding protein